MNAETFKSIRIMQRMTQEQFGEHLGIGQSTVAHIEAGRYSISDRVRGRLAQTVDTKQVLSFLSRLDEIENITPIKS